MTTEDAGPLTQRTPAVRTKVVGRAITVEAMALRGQPHVCATCRRPFRQHADAELRACAATCEPTHPTGDDP